MVSQPFTKHVQKPITEDEEDLSPMLQTKKPMSYMLVNPLIRYG
jgi:hypothetical protein